MNEFNLETYLTVEIENLVKQMLKTAVFHPRESAFMAKYAIASKKAAMLRREAEQHGEHIPAFLIASITSMCNLHCVGCYARSVQSCVDGEAAGQLSGEEWGQVFAQARDLGIGFILLAGGEPMVRKDVILKAAQFPEILFPIFTNGTLLTDEYLNLFDRYRNLIPVLSIEGGQVQTDARRGNGMFKRLTKAMQRMAERRIAFGASITVTSENLTEVTAASFIDELSQSGCKAIIYVEFVPVNESLHVLALSDAQRQYLDQRVTELRNKKDSLLLLSFPGDEKSSGGCLAAGRGFFHINSHGGAEPCPFSPYSDINVKDHTLKEVMSSMLFRNLQEKGLLTQKHEGGCVLYEKRQQVEALL